jgi:cyclopropane-fatty-acyl-phospholipid synthase
MLLHVLLSQLIRSGTLKVTDAGGRVLIFGDGKSPCSALRFHSRAVAWKLPLNPSLYFAEGYMDGVITIEEGGLDEFLEITLKNYERLEEHWLFHLLAVVTRQTRWLAQYNSIRASRRNIAHHYDLSDRLYELFLDRDRNYSCAYFTEPHNNLERAQEDKKLHLASKLMLDRPGLKVLDIGSGWGGLGLFLAETAGCEVTGLTLSEEQYQTSKRRARRAGLESHCRFRLRDYREEQERYDRIVSVGMFEHVGRRHYDKFFAKLRDLLADDGVCLLHSIGRCDPPGGSNPFIRKYIFPGGELPALSEVLAAVERSGLFVTDLEILRLHYAETIKLWHERFEANRREIAALYDERFCRMWELYLKASEMSFRHQAQMVFQMQLTRTIDALPVTRDYITDWERRRGADSVRAAE